MPLDPYGNPLTGQVPENSDGDHDNAWLGQHQRGLEHPNGLHPIIEMGARQYSPILGRFLEIDPVEGGNSNDYSYPADPANAFDLDGNCGICIAIGAGYGLSPAGRAVNAAAFRAATARSASEQRAAQAASFVARVLVHLEFLRQVERELDRRRRSLVRPLRAIVASGATERVASAQTRSGRCTAASIAFAWDTASSAVDLAMLSTRLADPVQDTLWRSFWGSKYFVDSSFAVGSFQTWRTECF